MGGTPSPPSTENQCEKKKVFFLNGIGGYPPPLNGQNPLKRFWKLPLYDMYNCTYIGADKSRLMCNHSNQHLRHQWQSQCISQLVQVVFNRFSPFSVPKWKNLAQLTRSYFTLQISYKKKDFAAICFHFGTENFVEQFKTIHLHFTILA